MQNQPSINDWAEHLIWAEKNLKDLENKLLHKEYDMQQLTNHVDAIKHSLEQTLVWARNAKQTQR